LEKLLVAAWMEARSMSGRSELDLGRRLWSSDFLTAEIHQDLHFTPQIISTSFRYFNPS
jgi:hypothetical protein